MKEPTKAWSAREERACAAAREHLWTRGGRSFTPLRKLSILRVASRKGSLRAAYVSGLRV